MADDVFKLGNFEGIEGDTGIRIEPLSNPLPSVPLPQGEREVIKHPTVKADVQAKFRSPRPELQFLELPLDKIVPNEFQPRRVFDEDKLRELADSIRENGIIQPLVVLAREDGLYEIVVGERRFRASRLAGMATVPVFVSQPLNEETKLELALIENVQRADLNPIEEGRAYERLRTEFGLQVQEIARKVGKDASTISNLLRLLGLPVEIQRALIEGVVTEGQARSLLTLRDREEMLAMFKIVRERGMKVRDIEAKVREIRERKIKVKEMFTPDPVLDSFENLLRGKLGTRVEINKGAKGGKITIEFFSDEDLQGIVEKFSNFT